MTPRHDLPRGREPASLLSEARLRRALERVQRQRRRPPGKPGTPGANPCPVDPNRPLDLSGGAAAALPSD